MTGNQRDEELFAQIQAILKQGAISPNEIAHRGELAAMESPDHAIVVAKLIEALDGELDCAEELRVAVASRMILRQMKQMGVDPESPTGEQVFAMISKDEFEPLVDEAILATARRLAGIGE